MQNANDAHTAAAVNDTEMHPNLAAAIDQLADAPDAAAAAAAAASLSVLPHQYQAQQWTHDHDAAAGAADEEAAAVDAADAAVLSLARMLSAEEAAVPGGVLRQLAAAHEHCFAAVTAPMGLPRPTSSSPHLLSFTEPDTLMSATRWSSRVIGVVSDWVRLDGLFAEDRESAASAHPDAGLPAHVARLASEAAFKREVSWAVHLSLPALIVPNLRPGSCANAARCINQALLQTQFLNLWVHVPLVAATPAFDPSVLGSDAADAGAEPKFSDAADPWRTWDAVRSACESHKRLGVCLELTADLPPFAWVDSAANLARDPSSPASPSARGSSPEDFIVARWLGEPVRAVLLDAELFSTNRKGYPVLSKLHQKLIAKLWQVFPQAQWILKDSASAAVSVAAAGSAAAPAAAAASVPASSPPSLGLVPHNYYLRHLYRQHIVSSHSSAAVFSRPYLDYLQAPLQPLADNLESGVYEVFERDPVKYAKYQQAITEALGDLVREGKIKERKAEVMVVGAGRGPLLRCVLRASAASGVAVNLLAVEKNPNAVETLQSLQRHDPEFKDITIFSGDMREWNGPAAAAAAGAGVGAGSAAASAAWKADVIVSELLGSFGDNELSPECLESVLSRFLAPQHGLSIPENSVSYLAPISSSKLWSDVNSFDALKSFETSYVVQLCNHYRAADELRPCFKFEHFRPGFRGDDAEAALAAAPAKAAGGNGPSTAAAVETEGGWTAAENPALVAAETQRMQTATAASAAASGASVSVSAASVSSPSSSSSSVSHNRHASLSWSIPLSCTVHGFGGYFRSRLYKATEISIVPGSRFSTGMFSWFPLFFPVRTPLTVPSGSTLSADFWRCTSPRKVWYEWALTAPHSSPIHNPNARGSFIGL